MATYFSSDGWQEGREAVGLVAGLVVGDESKSLKVIRNIILEVKLLKLQVPT